MPQLPFGWRMPYPPRPAPREMGMSERHLQATARHCSDAVFHGVQAREQVMEAGCTGRWSAEALDHVGGKEGAREYRSRVVAGNWRSQRAAGHGRPIARREYAAIWQLDGQGTANVELQLEELRQHHAVIRARLQHAAATPAPRLAHPEHNNWYGQRPNPSTARAPRPPRSAYGPYFGAN